MTYIGRPNNAGPASDIFPLSGSTASSPAILITATTATGGGTIVHTCTEKAWDSPYMIVSNVGASAATVYAQIGSTATTGQRQFSVAAGSFTTVYSYDLMMSNSGTFSFWATATAGVYITGQVARFFTSTGS